jgi:MoaA/NifB/PqqE/SkfB family radical SAM enzyme
MRDWLAVIDEAADLGCEQIQFIGGEPTLHPGLERMIVRARARAFSFIEVFTNATRLSARHIACFREHGVSVATSFYDRSAAAHDAITQNAGSWKRVLGGLEAVLAADLPLRVGIIEMDENRDEADATVVFLKSLGVQDISIDRRRGIGRGGREADTREGERFDELCGKCGRGKLCVTPSGMAHPCVFSRATPVGRAQDGLAAILDGSALRAFREKMLGLFMADCNPDCMPACRPNCNPDCMPYCNPNCNPDCMPNCNPNCNPDRRR